MPGGRRGTGGGCLDGILARPASAEHPGQKHQHRKPAAQNEEPSTPVRVRIISTTITTESNQTHALSMRLVNWIIRQTRRSPFSLE
jgi:hypothetical protein